MSRLNAAEKATRFQEWVMIVCTCTMAILAMGWIAMRGDDIRADRMGITVEELDRIERSQWADHPNESRCGWPCIERLPKTGETWGE
jgi:hypothetical protein